MREAPRPRSTLLLPCFLWTVAACGSVAAPKAQERAVPLEGREAFVVSRVERLRGQAFPADVALVRRTRDEARAWAARTSTDAPREGEASGDADDAAWIERALAAFGLIPADGDADEKLGRLLGDAVQGTYEPQARTLTLVADEGEDVQAATLAHEAVHAIDDAHETLRDHVHPARGELDRWLAGRCLVEGNAEYHEIEYQLASRGQDVLQFKLGLALDSALSGLFDGDFGVVAGRGAARDQALAAAPPALIGVLALPYVAGAAFVRDLKRRGGASAVDGAFAAPPRTTAEVLHGERYGDPRARPAEIEIGSLNPALASYAIDHTGTLGEYLARLVAGGGGGVAWKSARTDIEWNGDRYALLVDGERSVVVWRSQWREPSAARSFARRMVDVLGERDGATVGAAEQGVTRIVEGEFEHAVEQREAAVFVVRGARPREVEPALDVARTALVRDAGPADAGRGFLGALGAAFLDSAEPGAGVSRTDGLMGLLFRHEDRPGGFDTRIGLAGLKGLFHVESTPDRWLVGLAFDFVNLRRDARSGVTTLNLAETLNPAWSRDGANLEAALEMAAWSTWSDADQDGWRVQFLPGLVFDADRVSHVAFDGDGTAREGALIRRDLGVALGAIRYRTVAEDQRDPGTTFKLLWGLLAGYESRPTGWSFWTPLLGWKGTPEDSGPTFFWGLLG